MAILLITYFVEGDDDTRDALLKKTRELGEWKQLSESSYAVWTRLSTEEAVKSLAPRKTPKGTVKVFACKLNETLDSAGHQSDSKEIRDWIWANLNRDPPLAYPL